MDPLNLRQQFAQGQHRLSEIAAQIDRLSSVELEALALEYLPLLTRLNAAPGDTLPPLFDLTPHQYRSILDAVSVGITVYDGKQIIRYVNQRAIDYIGYDPTGETRNEYLQKLTLTDWAARPISMYARPATLVWEGSLARDVPMMITNVKGEVLQVLVTAIPLFHRGEFAGAVVIWNDVTLLEQAMLEVKRQEEQLRESEARHNEYAARIELHHRLKEQREQNLLHFAEKIHDGPLQGMISLIANIQLARDLAPENSDHQVLNELESQARTLADELRDVHNELNPPSATRFGLKRAIEAYTQDLQYRYPGIRFELNMMEDILKLSEPICLSLYRIYREAIQNAIQHAAASTITVRLIIHQEEIGLEIKDNGVGFTPSTDWMEMIQHGRFGLVSMKELADSIHAKLVLISEPGEGTLVRVSVPNSH